MLSRGNSEASARLRRAKSSASIKPRHSLSFEPCASGPSVARDQALAAASHAFEHAVGQQLIYKTTRERESQSSIPKADPPFNHSRSIRFAGSTAVFPQGTQITTRAAPTSHLNSGALRESSQIGLRRQSSSIQADAGFLTALPVHGEYVETRVASQPSSYRKLRKSKSMFNSRDLSKTFSSTGMHSAAFRSRGDFRSAGGGPGQALNHTGTRLGRPFTFLRSQAEQISSQDVISKAGQDEAVVLARDQFRRGKDLSSVDEVQWSRDAAIRRRSQKTFRKTVRTSSTNYYSNAVESSASPSNDWSERKSVGSKARALSSSFKNRLKRVFNLSSAEEGTLPVQHLQATRQYFGGTTKPIDALGTESKRAPTPNLTTPDRGTSRQEEKDYIPPRQMSLVRSTHNMDNDIEIDDERSRVTSWTNSTAANTMISRDNSESKRLSIIQETSSVPPSLGPLRHTGTLQAGILPFYGQRRKNSLYARLQQRMIKSHSTSHLNLSLLNGPDTCGSAKVNLEMSSSGDSRAQVIHNHCLGDHDMLRTSIGSRLTQSPSIELEGQYSVQEIPGATQVQVKTEQARVAISKGPLRESKSMFFPQSTYIERSRTSPFRQAMQSSGRSEQKMPENVTYKSFEICNRTTPIFDAHENRDGSISRSESIYSRNSSGDTPLRYNDPESPRIEQGALDQINSVSPDATLEFTKDSVGSPTESVRVADIVDLQTQISKQCVLSNPKGIPCSQIGSTTSKRTIGHKREHAQIDGEDTNIGRLQAPKSLLKESLNTPIGIDSRSSLMLTPPQPMIDRFPLMSINTQRNSQYRSPANMSKITQDAAVARVRQPSLRNDKGGENVRPKRSTASLSSRSSNVKAYDNTRSESKNGGSGLRDDPQNGNLWPVSTPVSHSRSSPERIARLRRMYSSNTLGSPSLARHIEPPTRSQKLTCNKNDEDKPAGSMVTPDIEGYTPCDCIDIFPDSQKMVNTFLSNRRRSRGDNVLDTVFI